MSGLATRLYKGEANLQIVGRRKLWFGIGGGLLLVAILSMLLLKFEGSIEFKGGNQFQLPGSVGSAAKAEEAVGTAVRAVDPNATIHTAQEVTTATGSKLYTVRTSTLDTEKTRAAEVAIETALGAKADEVTANQVSASWGKQTSNESLIALGVFLLVVTAYLIIRFEWRMAVAAVSSLLFDLALAGGVYALTGFEVTPSTVIGFLTILGFALYDVVVVFDKVQENTKGITGSSTQTYAEATNMALNQTFMRSINTSLVALLPVGGLLFIGPLLGATTLKDLGLVLFIGMAAAVYSSLFFATPVLVWLKERSPWRDERIENHTARVLARRAALAARPASDVPVQTATGAALAGVAPKAGVKPVRSNRPTRPAGKKR